MIELKRVWLKDNATIQESHLFYPREQSLPGENGMQPGLRENNRQKVSNQTSLDQCHPNSLKSSWRCISKIFWKKAFQMPQVLERVPSASWQWKKKKKEINTISNFAHFSALLKHIQYNFMPFVCSVDLYSTLRSSAFYLLCRWALSIRLMAKNMWHSWAVLEIRASHLCPGVESASESITVSMRQSHVILMPFYLTWFLFQECHSPFLGYCETVFLNFFFIKKKFFFCLFRAAPVAYGSSQARGQIGAVAIDL